MYGLLMILSFEELDCSHVWVEATQRLDDLELQDAINMQHAVVQYMHAHHE